MAYEYENDVISVISTETVFSHEETEKEARVKELQEVYLKAKILDEVKNFTTERLKEQKHTDEYDFGERLMCEEIEEIIGGQIND